MNDHLVHQLELALVLHTPSSSPFLGLDVDCCEEIFDYISLKDLVSIGQTCKRMQRIFEYCLQQNHSNLRLVCGISGIPIINHGINRFTRFIRDITIDYDNLQLFQYIDSNPLDTLTGLTFKNIFFTNEKIACTKKTLNKIEFIALCKCELNVDFHELLKLCSNLKQFIAIRTNVNNLLPHKYPKLEHLALFPSGMSFHFNELKTFLDLNSNIKTLSIDSNILTMNRIPLLEANLKLRVLCIVFLSTGINSVFRILNELWAKGSFKMLTVFIGRIDEQFLEEIVLLPSIEKIAVVTIDRQIAWKRIIHLKELGIGNVNEYIDLESLAKDLGNIENITFLHMEMNMNKILPFIRHSPKITRITVVYWNDQFDLLKLNDERKKLAEARKIMIFVKEDVYLATKWTMNDTKQSLIEIKRNESKIEL